MEKELVLDVGVMKIDDVWSVWHIKKINRKILKNGIKDKFYINDNWYHFEITEGETDFYYSVKDINSQEEPTLNINYKDDGIPNLIENNEVNDLVLVTLEINEKYGIRKRWRAEEGESYYTISGVDAIKIDTENLVELDNRRYEMGNYFQKEEEAQKIIDSKEWQDFWEKVRIGEIGD
jgi:hypothetical protein|uniref:Uncharacterized protein n=1 Tax=Siphoviridae sp. ct6rT12 TaxID=2825346 RepID=A0A8S5V9E1_9CAUD|nr:MAG TPA: hypothetical protein [Siphoviridae sp. ct6rT12]